MGTAMDQSAFPPGFRELLGKFEAPTPQLEDVVRDIRARRAQTQAVRTQLEAFDEQLASLEATLEPLLEWARGWTDLQQAFLDPWRRRGSDEES
jgi:hypothetical protein